jgi:hypothetical protein
MTLFEAGQSNDIRIFGGDRHTGVLMFGDYPPEILNIIRRVHMPASLSMESLSQELSDTYLQWYTQGRYYVTGPIQSILQGLSDEAIYASKQYGHSVTNEGHIDAGHTEFEMLRLLWDACHATMSPCDFEHGIQPQISSACFMLHLAAKASSTSPASDMYGERPVPVGRSFLSVMQMFRILLNVANRVARAGNLHMCRLLATNRPQQFLDLILAADCATLAQVAASEAFGFSVESLRGLVRQAKLEYIPGPNNQALYSSNAYREQQRERRSAVTPHPTDQQSCQELLSPELLYLGAVLKVRKNPFDPSSDVIERVLREPTGRAAPKFRQRHYKAMRVLIDEDVMAHLARTLPAQAYRETREYAKSWQQQANEWLFDGGDHVKLERMPKFLQRVRIDGKQACSFPRLCMHPGCYTCIRVSDAQRHTLATGKPNSRYC